MKKYKLLLTGKNKSVIDDFFTHVEMECMSSSRRYDDIIGHFKYYKPDMLVYCLQNEDSEDINRIKTMKTVFQQNNVALAIVGDRDDCVKFEKFALGIADLVITRPMSTKAIEEKIELFLREQERNMMVSDIKGAAEGNQEILQKVMSGKLKLDDVEPPEEEYKRKHVLVVDDDIRMLKVVKEHLKNDYDVATAINGKLAIGFLQKKKTDLILLDYVMPGESGPEVFRKLKENPETKNIPVLFVTGVDDLSKIQEVLKLRPQGYLLKPIDRNKLMESVKKIIG